MVKLLAFLTRGVGLILGFSSLSDETLNRGPMTIFQDKLLTWTDCDEAGDYVVPNVLSPRDLVFRPDIGHKLYHHLNHAISHPTPKMGRIIISGYKIMTGTLFNWTRQ